METMREAWVRLEAWCAKNDPDAAKGLNPGASAKRMAEVEKTIGQPLPGDVREFLMIHDGQRDGVRGVLYGIELMRTEKILSSWKQWSELLSMNEEMRDMNESHPSEAIALDYANLGWVPLTHDGGGCHLGVDLSPGPKGKKGQAINFGRDEEIKLVLAPSWREFVSKLMTVLESADAATRREMKETHLYDAVKKLVREGKWND